MIQKAEIVVVYSKSKRSNAKKYLKVFENEQVDNILNSKKKKYLPEDVAVHEIGVGGKFKEVYTKKHGL